MPGRESIFRRALEVPRLTDQARQAVLRPPSEMSFLLPHSHDHSGVNVVLSSCAWPFSADR